MEEQSKNGGQDMATTDNTPETVDYWDWDPPPYTSTTPANTKEPEESTATPPQLTPANIKVPEEPTATPLQLTSADSQEPEELSNTSLQLTPTPTPQRPIAIKPQRPNYLLPRYVDDDEELSDDAQDLTTEDQRMTDILAEVGNPVGSIRRTLMLVSSK